MKLVKLIKVSGEANNNKYYNMTQDNDNQFMAEYGRVGSSAQTRIYSMDRWQSTYNSKLKKGYRDITEFQTISKGNSELKIDNTGVQIFIEMLQNFANQSVSNNYLVGAESVTQAQIDECQSILNQLTKLNDIYKANNMLLSIYEIIPRKMKNVRENLLAENPNKKSLNAIISYEQRTLDVMAGQVATQIEIDNDAATLEEAFGISVTPVDEDVEAMILRMMAFTDNQDLFKKAYAVTNLSTQSAFDNQRANSSNDAKKLLWHGSRNENWWSIINSGLLIRPTNAIHTGSMYGDGIYGANKAQKSIGYTSLEGSYWSKGNQLKGFLALYEFHVGNQYHIHQHRHSYYDLSLKGLQSLGNYDSVYAHAGYSLRNDEFIIYRPEQCTIKYIVQIER